MVALEELEAPIATPNGQVNGYHDGGRVAEATALQESIPLNNFDSFPRVQLKPAAAPVVADAETGEQAQTATTTKDKAKPAKSKSTPQVSSKTGTKAAQESKSGDPKLPYVPTAQLRAELSRLQRLSRAALTGDAQAVDKLRAALGECPHVWRWVGDLQFQVEHKLVELVAERDPLRLECFRKRCSELRYGLLDGESATLATKMAASRAVMCWLFTQLLELRILAAPEELDNIRALEQAERRFAVAMRTLHLAKRSELELQRLAQPTRQGG
jgi:hypothetical protein